MPVTIREVAQRAGVSTATVSRVLNDNARVRSATRRRVERAVAALGYQPNDIARSMARGRTATIGLVLDDLSNPFNAQAAEAIMSTMEQGGYRTIVTLTHLQSHRCAMTIQFLLGQRVDGFIFGQVHQREPAVEALLAKGHPIVLFNRRLRRPNVPFVVCNNFEGGKAVGRHLAALGHRRTALIAGPRTLSTVVERVAGYRAAIHEARLLEPVVIYTGYRAGDAAAAMAELFGRKERRPTAVFATTDAMALEVLEYTADRGLRVPEDLAVVGFDDIDIASHRRIRLTTVAQRVTRQAMRAAERLRDGLSGDGVSPTAEFLPAELIVRRTCGGGR